VYQGKTFPHMEVFAWLINQTTIIKH
jgi:hypothetical protein